MHISNKSDDELKSLAKTINDELESRKPKQTTIYLHGSKEDRYSDGYNLKLTDKQLENFAYVAYEVSIRIEIDKDGHAVATHLNDVALTEKVQI